MESSKQRFKFVDDLTSDVMFEAYGKDEKELFENAALALANVICKVEQVGNSVTKEIEAAGKNLEELMINWLQGIIAVVDTDEIFLSEFEVKEISETHLKAVCRGEAIIPEKGETVVKAVTYYKFRLEQTKKGYKAVVSVDI